MIRIFKRVPEMIEEFADKVPPWQPQPGHLLSAGQSPPPLSFLCQGSIGSDCSLMQGGWAAQGAHPWSPHCRRAAHGCHHRARAVPGDVTLVLPPPTVTVDHRPRRCPCLGRLTLLIYLSCKGVQLRPAGPVAGAAAAEPALDGLLARARRCGHHRPLPPGQAAPPPPALGPGQRGGLGRHERHPRPGAAARPQRHLCCTCLQHLSCISAAPLLHLCSNSAAKIRWPSGRVAGVGGRRAPEEG